MKNGRAGEFIRVPNGGGGEKKVSQENQPFPNEECEVSKGNGGGYTVTKYG